VSWHGRVAGSARAVAVAVAVGRGNDAGIGAGTDAAKAPSGVLTQVLKDAAVLPCCAAQWSKHSRRACGLSVRRAQCCHVLAAGAVFSIP